MTDDETERRALTLLDEAFGRPSSEREAFVLGATHGAPELRRRTLCLLGTEGRSLRTGGGLDGLGEDDAPPERIGPWRLGELVGRGGMGAVWTGERDDGAFEQRVAIKLMRRAGPDDRLASRLRNELRTLARLSHPNVAQVLDGGETAGGVPYIVMEYVDGAPLHEARGGMPLTARLDLMAAVLQAVAYAHGMEVAHRDVSPANVLVRPDGVVKLIDFGISRSLAGDSAEGLSTARTVGFAAPERASGGTGDAASDVYSLGRLLAYLTEGTAPPRPRDLAAIAAKASAERPEDRYASVDAMAEDLRCYRQGLTVSPRQGLAVAALRFAGRHPFGSVASAAALLVLATGLGVSTTLLVRAERAEEEAVARFDRLADLARTIMYDVYDALEGMEGTAEARRLVMEIGRDYLLELERDPRADAALRLDVAEGATRLGLIAADAGQDPLFDPQQAEGFLTDAERRLTALLAEHPEDTEVAARLGHLLRRRFVNQFVYEADLEAAEASITRAIALTEPAAEAEAEGWEHRWQRQSLLSDYAQLLLAQQRIEEARRVLDRGIALAQAMGEGIPAGRAWYSSSNLRGVLADTYAHEGDADRVLSTLDRALADLDRAATAPGAEMGFLRRQRVVLLYDRGSALREAGRFEAALADFAEGIAVAERRLELEPDGDGTYWRALLSGASAVTLARLGRFDEALAAQDAADAYFDARLEAMPGDARARQNVLEQRFNAARLYRDWGRLGEQCAAQAAAVATAEAMRADGQLTPEVAAVNEYVLGELPGCDD